MGALSGLSGLSGISGIADVPPPPPNTIPNLALWYEPSGAQGDRPTTFTDLAGLASSDTLTNGPKVITGLGGRGGKGWICDPADQLTITAGSNLSTRDFTCVGLMSLNYAGGDVASPQVGIIGGTTNRFNSQEPIFIDGGGLRSSGLTAPTTAPFVSVVIGSASSLVWKIISADGTVQTWTSTAAAALNQPLSFAFQYNGYISRMTWMGCSVHASGSLAAADVSKLIAYWQSRAVRAFSPTLPLLLCQGNSISLGYPGATAWTVLFAAANATYQTWNDSLIGRTDAQIAATNITSHLSGRTAAQAATHLIHWDGTNSINGGQTGAQTYAVIKARAQAIKAINSEAKVTVIGCLPRGTFSGAQNTERLALNAAFLADCPFAQNIDYIYEGSGTQDWFDYYIAAQDDFRLDDSSDTTYYNADTIHLTTAGEQAIAELVESMTAL